MGISAAVMLIRKYPLFNCHVYEPWSGRQHEERIWEDYRRPSTTQSSKAHAHPSQQRHILQTHRPLLLLCAAHQATAHTATDLQGDRPLLLYMCCPPISTYCSRPTGLYRYVLPTQQHIPGTATDSHPFTAIMCYPLSSST